MGLFQKFKEKLIGKKEVALEAEEKVQRVVEEKKKK